MPIVRLYTPANKPLESHHVTSPGGYEWWQFVIENNVAGPGNACRLTLDICDGNPFDRAYRRAYARYRRRPTRNRPPLPGEYPSSSLLLERSTHPPVTLQQACLPNGFDPDQLPQPDGAVVLACNVATR